ncbi:MAG: hypothetical protein A3G34_10965 [Candidatus Lindowbacteria bacterium RIFCSPLOWO2_12_FULL_62_27]|nr:MAG: hypothetical protein A3I06_12040 [Candidatus Lindowbacteria bacterium RIFCSPLOWO2_02_FULL_62_12]OGH60639.1 MAG: hypothetical protein A3G34_10965 [Candidatus Lindowbacteria bacterium RIFCSPLOWO2_12_FULL_62_27]
MREFAKLPSLERDTIFLETANRRGLSRLVVEKDFWVCFTLSLLFESKQFDYLFVFKAEQCGGLPDDFHA